MRKVSMKYHEKMFYFWYGKNSAMRDYHGKKYHQAVSLPTGKVNGGVEFRNHKRDATLVIQCVAIGVYFTVMMLGLVAQFA